MWFHMQTVGFVSFNSCQVEASGDWAGGEQLP